MQHFDRNRTSTLPARAGLGLKPEHYAAILEGKPDVGFFEVHAENYMGKGGPPHRYLRSHRRTLSAFAAWRRPLDRRRAASGQDASGAT